MNIVYWFHNKIINTAIAFQISCQYFKVLDLTQNGTDFH